MIVVLAVMGGEESSTAAITDTLPAMGGTAKLALYVPSPPVVTEIGIETPPADIVSWIGLEGTGFPPASFSTPETVHLAPTSTFVGVTATVTAEGTAGPGAVSELCPPVGANGPDCAWQLEFLPQAKKPSRTLTGAVLVPCVAICAAIIPGERDTDPGTIDADVSGAVVL